MVFRYEKENKLTFQFLIRAEKYILGDQMENTSGKPISPSPFIKNKQPNVDQLQK